MKNGLLQTYHKILEAFVGIMFGGMIVCMTIGILGRYLPFIPVINWYMEATLIMVVYMVLVGSAVAIQYKTHIGVDLLVNAMPPGLRKVVMLFVRLVTCVWLVLLFRGALTAVEKGMLMRFPVLGLQKSWAYFAFLLGIVCMLIEFVLLTVEDLRGPKPAASEATAVQEANEQPSVDN